MKVNKNWSSHPIVLKSGQYSVGTPLRLEIASRLLASLVAARGFVVITEHNLLSEASLSLADKLIEAHNKTCEGE